MPENIQDVSGATGPVFDPDSALEQSDASLRALIGRIEHEMAEFQFERFSRSDALTLGLLLVEYGTERSLPIAIDITAGEQVIFHVALEGATADNDIWIKNKSRTAARFAVPSLLVGLRPRRNGRRMEENAWFDQTRYAAHGGSFPLFIKGVGPVATVTVSGLPQQQDHDLVVEALRQFRDENQ